MEEPVVASAEVTPDVVPEVVVETVEVVAASVETPASVVVTHEEIAKLAYSYWVERGYQGGSPHEDWVRAEQALVK